MYVRPATKADIPAIARLLLQVHDVHRVGRPDLFAEGMRKYSDEELDELLDRGREAPVFVAVDDDGTVIGHAFCIREEHAGHHGWQNVDTLYIDDICVDAAARGKHVGTALYRAVVAYARDEGYYNVTLNVWEINKEGRAFYEAMGMRVYKVGMEQVL